MMRRRMRQIIAGVLAASFLFWETASLKGQEFTPSPEKSLSDLLLKDPFRFEAPLEHVSLKKIHRGTKDVFIIHIQDAHANYSGQLNLAHALDTLMSQYPVSLVFVEGASKDVTLTPLKQIAPKKVWETAAKNSLLQGKIQGEEYLNLTSDQPFKIVGIEDMALYFRSLEHYKNLTAKRENVLSYLKEIKSVVRKLKTKLYPQELLDYERKTEGDKTDFETQFKALLGLLGPTALSLEDHPNLKKLKTLQGKEEEIDFQAAHLEHQALLERMGEGNGGTTIFRTHFHNTLNKARERNIALSDYPNLLRYEEYLESFSKIDMDQILEETKDLEERTYEALLEGKEAKLLRALDRFLELLLTAYQIQMTHKEFNLFELNREDFNLLSSLAFLNRRLMDLGYFEDLVPYKALLEEGEKDLQAFYESVSQRDLAFIRNIERMMDKGIAFLITGGYHTDHLKELMKERGYSYAILTPIVTADTNQEKYEKLLLEPVQEKQKAIKLTNGQFPKDSSPIRVIASLQSMEREDPGNSRAGELARTAAQMAGDEEAPERMAEAILEAKRQLDRSPFQARPLEEIPVKEESRTLGLILEETNEFAVEREAFLQPSLPMGARLTETPAKPITPKERREADLLRRQDIDTFVQQIREEKDRYSILDGIVAKIRKKEDLKEVLSKEDLSKEEELPQLKKLQNDLLSHHPLAALRKKVKPGHRIVTFNQKDVKTLNTVLGQISNNQVIRERQKALLELLQKSGLVSSPEEAAVSLTYKQDVITVESNLTDEALQTKLDEVSRELSSRMDQYLKKQFPEKEEDLKEKHFQFTSYYGVSERVQPEERPKEGEPEKDDMKLLASLQALQSAKMARIENDKNPEVVGVIFDQETLDELVKEAQTLIKDEPPSEEEMLSVRKISVSELEELKKEDPTMERRLNVKKYLNILDLFDFPKPWMSSQTKEALAQRDEILRLVSEVEGFSEKARAPPEFAETLRRAISILQRSPKDPGITEDKTFHLKSTSRNGVVLSADVVGFYAKIQSHLLQALQSYSRVMGFKGVPQADKQLKMLKLALQADDEIKRTMKKKRKSLWKALARIGLSIPQEDLKDGKKALLGSIEGGDEINFFVERGSPLEKEKLESLTQEAHNIGLRIALGFHKGGDLAEHLRDFTDIAGPYGQHYKTTTDADGDLKKVMDKLNSSPEKASPVKTGVVSVLREGEKIHKWVYYPSFGGTVLSVDVDEFLREEKAGEPRLFLSQGLSLPKGITTEDLGKLIPGVQGLKPVFLRVMRERRLNNLFPLEIQELAVLFKMTEENTLQFLDGKENGLYKLSFTPEELSKTKEVIIPSFAPLPETKPIILSPTSSLPTLYLPGKTFTVGDLFTEYNKIALSVEEAYKHFLAKVGERDEPLVLTFHLGALPREKEAFTPYLRSYLVTALELSRKEKNLSFRFVGDPKLLEALSKEEYTKKLVQGARLVEKTPKGVKEILLAARSGILEYVSQNPQTPYVPLAPLGQEDGDLWQVPYFKASFFVALAAGKTNPGDMASLLEFQKVYGSSLRPDLSRTLKPSILQNFLKGDISSDTLTSAEVYALTSFRAIDWKQLLQFLRNMERIQAMA